jgi:hypothetical protein
MHKLWPALALSLIVGALGGCGQQTAEPGGGPGDEGKPNPDLGPVTDIGAYQIQPPKGYTPTDPKFVEPDEYSWDGPRRGDKPGGLFVVKIWPEQREEKPFKKEVEVGEPTLDDYFSAAVGRVKPFWANWQVQGLKRFTSHGMPFIGTQWKGTDRESQKPCHGFVYVALSGKQVLEITGNDVEPHHETLLKAAEEAVGTLRKRLD